MACGTPPPRRKTSPPEAFSISCADGITSPWSEVSLLRAGEHQQQVGDEDIADLTWELLNRLPRESATQLVQLVESSRAEAARLREEASTQAGELQRLDDALEDIREDAAETERELRAECCRLRASLAEAASFVERCGAAEAELLAQRASKDAAERRAEAVEAEAAELRSGLRSLRGVEERCARLEACVARARELEDAASPPPPPLPLPPGRHPLALQALELARGRGPAAGPAGRASAEELAVTAWALANFRVHDAEAMAALAEGLAAPGGALELGSQSACDGAWAFGALSVRHGPLFGALASSALRAPSTLEVGSIAGLLESGAAMAGEELQLPPLPGDSSSPLALQAVAAVVLPRLASLSPQELASAAAAAAVPLKTGRRDEAFLALLRGVCAEARARLPELSQGELARIVFCASDASEGGCADADLLKALEARVAGDFVAVG